MDFSLQVEDNQVRGALHRLLALGQNPQPALREVADLGENTTRERFRFERGPDGQRWKPSLRAQLTGGKTLTKDVHLFGSISSGIGRDYVEWGTNTPYARIHQFGGIIRAKSAGALKFAIPGGGFAVVKAVRMPARPYLGVNEDDRRGILDIFERRINGAAHAG